MSTLNQFTAVSDIPDLNKALQECLELKANLHATPSLGKNKTLGMVFLNPSLRTKMSMQRACQNIGLHTVVIDVGKGTWAWELEEGTIMNGPNPEHIKEAAKVMSQYCDILAIRCFPSLTDKEKDLADLTLKKFIQYAEVPVISMESATRHPLQSFADLLTIKEHWKGNRKPKVAVTWAPHIKPLAHAVPNSFCEWVKKTAADVQLAFPEGYDLAPEFTAGIKTTHRQEEALENADFIYVKSWSSFTPYGKMPEVKRNWKIDAKKLEIAPNAKIMHCLPVRRNVVISDFVLDSPNTLIYQQVHNRLITAQWVLKNII